MGRRLQKANDLYDEYYEVYFAFEYALDQARSLGSLWQMEIYPSGFELCVQNYYTDINEAFKLHVLW